MNGTFLRFLLPAIFVPLAGCIDSEAPLSDPDKAQADERLLGKWINAEKILKTNAEPLVIEKLVADGYPPGMMKFGSSGTGAEKAKFDLAFRSELQGKTYLNLCRRWTDPAGKPLAWKDARASGFTIFKYTVTENTLTFWLVDDEEPLKMAIMNGNLKGTVRAQGYDLGPTVHLQDTTANVAKVVAREDEKLFLGRKKAVFTRTK